MFIGFCFVSVSLFLLKFVLLLLIFCDWLCSGGWFILKFVICSMVFWCNGRDLLVGVGNLLFLVWRCCRVREICGWFVLCCLVCLGWCCVGGGRFVCLVVNGWIGVLVVYWFVFWFKVIWVGWLVGLLG